MLPYLFLYRLGKLRLRLVWFVRVKATEIRHFEEVQTVETLFDPQLFLHPIERVSMLSQRRISPVRLLR